MIKEYTQNTKQQEHQPIIKVNWNTMEPETKRIQETETTTQKGEEHKWWNGNKMMKCIRCYDKPKMKQHETMKWWNTTPKTPKAKKRMP